MTDSKEIIERLRDCGTEAKRIMDDPQTPQEDRQGFEIFWVTFMEAASALADLQARLRIAEKRADEAEARNEFLLTELDKLIEKAKET